MEATHVHDRIEEKKDKNKATLYLSLSSPRSRMTSDKSAHRNECRQETHKLQSLLRHPWACPKDLRPPGDVTRGQKVFSVCDRHRLGRREENEEQDESSALLFLRASQEKQRLVVGQLFMSLEILGTSPRMTSSEGESSCRLKIKSFWARPPCVI